MVRAAHALHAKFHHIGQLFAIYLACAHPALVLRLKIGVGAFADLVMIFCRMQCSELWVPPLYKENQ